jgi:hypothetical protein
VNKADFLYNYAKEYLQHNVKATLMRENWEDKDFNPKYHMYIEEYISLNDLFIKNKTSDEKIQKNWDFLRERNLNETYDFLFADVIKRLESKKGKITPEKQDLLKSRLKRLPNL